VTTTEEQERDKQYDRMKEKVLDQLKSQFRPEFLNRVDSFVVFRSLTVEEIREIVDLLLARVREQLKSQQIDLEITQEAKDHIIKLGYDVDYGARPLRRVIQNMVEDPLAEALLLGRFTTGQTVVVDRSPDAGLTIESLAEKTPVEAI
jgi:ATP-dependent Clp protease ATP-binding subunit ClpC